MRHLTGFASPFTADYLAHYNNDPAKLRAEIEPILTAAQHIIGSLQRLEPHGAPELEAEPETAQAGAAAPEIIPYDLWGEGFAQGVFERFLGPPRKQQEGQAE